MEWISVKERLPDDSHGRVLAWVREINDIGTSGYAWNCSYSDRHGFTDRGVSFHATHWMPLPEPPKK